MSPEQAKGKAVDKRTDIWAFGAVLYELLTGKAAFQGEDVGDILAEVVKAEPAWNGLSKSTPQAIRTLLRRCMRKDKRQRLQDAVGVRIKIEDAIAAPKDSGATGAAPASRSKLPWAVAAALAMVATVMAWGWWGATRPIEQKIQPHVRLDVDLGPNVSFGSLSGADEILSPDGTRLVYTSQGQLFTRRLDQPNATELPGTQGAFAPFFSPDGQWVAFFAPGKLKKISVEGGATIDVCNAGSFAAGGSWGEDGNILAALSSRVPLSRVSSGGGTPQPLNTLDTQAGEITQRWPQILPGSKAVLFTAHTRLADFDAANIDVMSLTDRSRKTLVRGGTFGRYLSSGHLVYVNRATLFALPFDLDRLEIRGTPAPLLENVAYSSNMGFVQFEFSRKPSGSGTFVYRSGSGRGNGLVTVDWLDATGEAHPLLAKLGIYQRPSISPDGERLALGASDGQDSDIWVYEWRRDTLTRLTYGGSGATGNPIWSPDGRYILFSVPGGIYWTRSDGGSKPQPLTEGKNQQVPFSITADGKHLAFDELAPGNGRDIFTVPVESDNSGLRAGKPEVFLQTPFDERQPALSPDGRWMAYTANDSGGYQVYVRAFPDKGGKWQISNSGGAYAEWSRDGHELFFRSPDNRIMVAAYTVKGDSFVADKPRVWSEKQLADFGLVGTKPYDLAPDGKRVAALMPSGSAEEQKAQNHVTFLMNFFDEVRRRTATQSK
jgi:Tol biopolymer transport system component